MKRYESAAQAHGRAPPPQGEAVPFSEACFAPPSEPRTKNRAFLPEARWAGQGATHASHGWPWMDTPGLRGAETGQRNVRIQRLKE